MIKRNWKEHAKLAKHYKAIGQKEIWLSEGNDFPWMYVDSVKPGGSHRLDIATSVWFRATHPTGLRFSWSFDIEPRSASGKGYYEIDVKGCREILDALPERARARFREYLGECAKSVEANALKFRKIAEGEFETARALKGLA